MRWGRCHTTCTWYEIVGGSVCGMARSSDLLCTVTNADGYSRGTPDLIYSAWGSV